MKLHFAIVALAASSLHAADPVALDVKPGQWEATVTTQMNGLSQGRQIPQIPPDQLAKLPPEQRARIEAAIKQAGGGPHTSVSKSCVKREDLSKLNVNNDEACKTTLVTSSRTKQEIHLECDRNGNKQTGTITVEALSSESIKFNIQAGGDYNGKNISMIVNGTEKWLGPGCDDSK